MSKFRHTRHSTRGALTLVELLVAGTILVVVLGLALGMASATEKASARLGKRQAAILYAQTALARIAEAASAAVDPAALNAITNRTPLTPVLTQHELGIVRYIDLGGPTLAQTLVKSPGRSASLIATTQPLAETAQGAVAATEVDLGGVAPEGFSASVEFGYAAAPAPGQAPVYAPQWAAAGLPDLIRITVRARPDAPEEATIELQTAVIPGFVRAPANGAPLAPAAGAPVTAIQEPAV